MIQLDLAAIANQSVSIRLDDYLYSLDILDTSGVMSLNIKRNGVDILQGQRAVAGASVIPYEHLEGGNFIFVTENGEYPDWRKFGSSQFLLYATADEIAEIRELYDIEVVPVANSIVLADAKQIDQTGYLLIDRSGSRLIISETDYGFLLWS